MLVAVTGILIKNLIKERNISLVSKGIKTSSYAALSCLRALLYKTQTVYFTKRVVDNVKQLTKTKRSCRA